MRYVNLNRKKCIFCVKWIYNFISLCIYMNMYFLDWLSIMFWYLLFEYIVKLCLSNFRINKEIIGLINFKGKKVLI